MFSVSPESFLVFSGSQTYYCVVAAFLHKAALDIAGKFDLASPIGDVGGAGSAPFAKLAYARKCMDLLFFHALMPLYRYRAAISEWDRSRSSSASTGIEAKQDFASIFHVGNHMMTLSNGFTLAQAVASFTMRAVAESITFPIATVMTRIAVQPNAPTGHLLKYLDPKQAFQTILNEEGFSGLYKGFSAQLVSDAIGCIIPYLSYKIFEPALDDIATAWRRVQVRFLEGKQTSGVVVQTDSQKSAAAKIAKHFWEELNQGRVVGLGLLAGLVYAGAMPLSYSFGLLSTRMRVNNVGVFPTNFFGFRDDMNMLDMLSYIFETEGAYGLVRGALWKFLWSQLTTGAILIRSFYKPTVWVQ
jgi:hypothetical protein